MVRRRGRGGGRRRGFGVYSIDEGRGGAVHTNFIHDNSLETITGGLRILEHPHKRELRFRVTLTHERFIGLINGSECRSTASRSHQDRSLPSYTASNFYMVPYHLFEKLSAGCVADPLFAAAEVGVGSGVLVGPASGYPYSRGQFGGFMSVTLG